MKCFNIVETLTASDVKFAERALGQQTLLDSSLPSVTVGAGASISAKTSHNSDYDASQSLSKSESMSSEELSQTTKLAKQDGVAKFSYDVRTLSTI